MLGLFLRLKKSLEDLLPQQALTESPPSLPLPSTHTCHMKWLVFDKQWGRDSLIIFECLGSVGYLNAFQFHIQFS